MLVVGLLSLPFSPVRVTDRGDEAASTRDPTERGFDALRRLVDKSRRPAVVRVVGGFPEAVRGQFAIDGGNPVERARGFLELYADLYGIADDTELHVRRIGGAPNFGVTFTQSYKSLPVFGASLTVATGHGAVNGANGRLLTRPLADVVPAIAAATAEATARGAAGRPDARILGTTALVVFDPSVVSTGPTGPVLAWRVTLGGSPATHVVVDAHGGGVLLVDAYQNEDAGTESFDLELIDAEGDANAKEDDCYWTSDDVTAGDEDGVDDDYGNDADVVQAYAGGKDAYLLYHGHGMHGYDDDETQMEIFLHAKVEQGKSPNARWVTCEWEEFMEINENFLDTETVLHEWGHGVIGSTSALKCCNETGALNESYADVMAVLGSGGWVLSENMLDGAGPLRNVQDPTSPATNRSPGAKKVSAMATACPGSSDNGQRHCKAGVPNKAHFLMSQGGSFNGVTVGSPGIGRGKTEGLAFWTMTNLPSGATFATARNTELGFAEFFRDYWAPGSPFRNPVLDKIVPQGYTDETVCRVIRAWAAVEVGAGDADCDGVDDGADDSDSDGVMDAADNCPGVQWGGFSDHDGDGMGDFCDPDDDNDGVKDKVGGIGDNCSLTPNPDQTDADFDGIGEACDPDEDGDVDDDGVPDEDDNCSINANADQADVDNDGDGDACDPDHDGDGKSNDDDNCPFTPNADQKDSDGDGLGDACDKCASDADQNVAFTTGIPELGVDPEPFVPDADGDGIPDACDGDRFGLGGPLRVNGKKPGRYVLGAPDDPARVIESQGRPGGEIEAPLDICKKRCPDGFDDKVRLVVECADLPGDVKLWVSDDEGLPVGKQQPGTRGGGQARFHPESGRSYFVHFRFHPRFDPNVPLRLTCRLTRQQARGGTGGGTSGRTTTSTSSRSTSTSATSVTTTPTGATTVTSATGTTTTVPTTTTRPSTTTTQPPDFTLSCSPSTLAAGPGGTDTSECTLKSVRGYAGRVTMSCAELPNNDACGFNPQIVSLAGGQTRMTTLTITAGRTTGSYSFRVVGQGDPGPTHSFAMTFNVS